MDHQDIRTLKILEAIDENQGQSQRDLAGKLNVSLGLVNSFIKRLARKGYFKITTIPGNRIKYILTPGGLAEKTRLSCEYIHFSFEFYQRARQQFRKLFQDLTDMGVSDIVLYGANDYAEIACITLQETKLNLKAVVDDDKTGRMFLGNAILDSSQLAASVTYDRIVVPVAEQREAVLQSLIDKGILREKIVLLD
ncbi:MAG: winged helix-turn-helix transcriptional regulator [Desulfobacterales bacterium]|nr:winged helix-turn-helix transcriptional regulator [Desulfobacterales bacterium]MDD4073297.1 winged helix-turn-helix transcriptional regulator [Desulfobacterales bacterium]MDD4393502.1 winged helix-turn-helix transcriptional regulator [Desulfobacterales bacterium]